MTQFSFTIPGIPHPQGRPRFARRGRFVHTYEAAKDTAWKNLVKAYARAKWKRQPPIIVPVTMTVTFFMPIPQSVKYAHEGMPHIKRPDVSNLLKGVEDALNGFVWKDDSQICNVRAMKVYSTRPRTEVTIEWGER